MQIVKLNNTDSISQELWGSILCFIQYTRSEPSDYGTVKTHVRQSIANLCSAETDLSKNDWDFTLL